MPQHGGTRAAVSLWECIRNEHLTATVSHVRANALASESLRGDRALAKLQKYPPLRDNYPLDKGASMARSAPREARNPGPMAQAKKIFGPFALRRRPFRLKIGACGGLQGASRHACAFV